MKIGQPKNLVSKYGKRQKVIKNYIERAMRFAIFYSLWFSDIVRWNFHVKTSYVFLLALVQKRSENTEIFERETFFGRVKAG